MFDQLQTRVRMPNDWRELRNVISHVIICAIVARRPPSQILPISTCGVNTLPSSYNKAKTFVSYNALIVTDFVSRLAKIITAANISKLHSDNHETFSTQK